ncbi:MAG TPA: hypothetical protein VNZ52_06025, partial [Candidatus Thermoplasmatota archaeon]|nr:hypothetical protein [Candidatus Thermoplasmatota archaeon]
MKEEVNSFDVRALVRELQVLVDGFLDKAYQPTREEVLLRFRVKRDATAGVPEEPQESDGGVEEAQEDVPSA